MNRYQECCVCKELCPRSDLIDTGNRWPGEICTRCLRVELEKARLESPDPDAPENHVTVERILLRENPVLTMLANTYADTDIIYIDQPWVNTAKDFGLNEEQSDLFRRYSEYAETVGELVKPNWISSHVMPDPVNYWGLDEKVVAFYCSDIEVAPKFEEFCNGYAAVVPGGHILLPRLVTVENFCSVPARSPEMARLQKDLTKDGQNRYRFIGAKKLHKDSKDAQNLRDNNRDLFDTEDF